MLSDNRDLITVQLRNRTHGKDEPVQAYYFPVLKLRRQEVVANMSELENKLPCITRFTTRIHCQGRDDVIQQSRAVKEKY